MNSDNSNVRAEYKQCACNDCSNDGINRLRIAFLHKRAPTLEWLFFYGPPNSTKSSTGEVILAFDGHEKDDDYIVSMAQVDTLARMGDTISRTTFPVLADEMELIGKQTN